MAKERKYIFIEKIKHNGMIVITDDKGNKQRYLGYTKREALSMFKNQYGYNRKRDVNVINETSMERKNKKMRDRYL